MQVSVKMEQTVNQLAEKHGVDLTRWPAYLHLQLAPYMPLAIYNGGMNTVRVMHLTHERGVDPEIVFWTGSRAGWVAIEGAQLIGGQRAYAALNEDATALVSIQRSEQAGLTRFAELWARNIVDQGWLEQSQKTQERFPLGDVVATPGALLALQQADISAHVLLEQHICGQWGSLNECDRQQNEQALAQGNRLLSRYVLTTGAVVWVISEWDRSATTVLTPNEY